MCCECLSGFSGYRRGGGCMLGPPCARARRMLAVRARGRPEAKAECTLIGRLAQHALPMRRHAAPGLATGSCRRRGREPGPRLCQLAAQQPGGRAGGLVGARQLGLQLVHLRARMHSRELLARPSAACAGGRLFQFFAPVSKEGQRGGMGLQCRTRAASTELAPADSAPRHCGTVQESGRLRRHPAASSGRQTGRRGALP